MSASLALGGLSIAWAAVISIVAVPWYIRLLGVESYGLIGFYASMQAAISMLDLGLGATISREVARSAALDNFGRARRLLRSLELVYMGAVGVIAAALVTAAPLIAQHWLRPTTLGVGTVQNALKLTALVVALRWPISLYLGALIGLHRALISYRITATMTTIGNVGAVAILLYGSRTLSAYFIWQAASALLYVIWVRQSAWKQLGGFHGARFDGTLLKTVLLQSIAMSGVAMTGLVLTQLDKAVVSSSSSLTDFGHYAVAGVLATGLSVLIIPTYNVIYPRLSALVATGTPQQQVSFYRLGTRLFLSCLAPIALSAFFYSYDLLVLWTGNAQLAAIVAPIAGFLFLGSALNGVMLFPYALQLAKGRTKLPLLINLMLIAVMLPMALVFVRWYGPLGGALTWFSLNASFVVIGGILTHMYILPELRRTWVFRDVAPSVLISAVIVSAGCEFANAIGLHPVARLAAATMWSLAATGVLLIADRDTRAVAGGGWSFISARIRSGRPDRRSSLLPTEGRSAHPGGSDA